MSETTTIEWTDATWNPIRGCSRVSTGCAGCYAEAMAARFSDPGQWGHLIAIRTDNGGRWLGNTVLDERALLKPLRWKKPRRIFVTSVSDPGHLSVTYDTLDKLFAVMALTPQHTYQLLTKRPARMRDYLISRNGMGNEHLCRAIDAIPAHLGNRHGALEMPLPNVWLGTSVENQAAADARIPHLLASPAAVRFLSCEPLLGPVDLTQWTAELCQNCLRPDCTPTLRADSAEVFSRCGAFVMETPRSLIDWVIAGGESGPKARPMHPDWARSLRDQCAAAGVPFFFKQWGEWTPLGGADRERLVCRCGWSGVWGGAGADSLQEHAKDCLSKPLACSSPPVTVMRRVGKKAAGRLLDGVEHNGTPEVRHG